MSNKKKNSINHHLESRLMREKSVGGLHLASKTEDQLEALKPGLNYLTDDGKSRGKPRSVNTIRNTVYHETSHL